MKALTNSLARGNLTARERFLTLIKNDIQRIKTGKEILTQADKYALEHWQAKTDTEAREWNTLNEGWKLSGRMDLEVEFIYKDAQVAHLAQLPLIMELLSYPAMRKAQNSIKILEEIKKASVEEVVEIVAKQKAAKLKEGLDFDYAVYQLAFELISEEDQVRMKELYPEIEYDPKYLDQEEVIANLFGNRNELDRKDKEKLAGLVSEASYNKYAKEYQLYHYFACIPVVEVAKRALKKKGIEVQSKDGEFESEAVRKSMESYALENNTTVQEMLKAACISWIDEGLFEEYPPLSISNESELFSCWLKSKKKAKEIIKGYVDKGELKIDKQTDPKRRNPSGVIITGESLYHFKTDYKFITEFKQRADTYNPDLGLVYESTDPKERGEHLDREFLICEVDQNGEPRLFSRHGMAIDMLSTVLESQSYFKEVRDGDKTFLEYRNPAYESIFRLKRKDLIERYAELLAYEAVFKKLTVIYEADMTHHVIEKLEAIRDFIMSFNKAVHVATNTEEEAPEARLNDWPFNRKDTLFFKEELLIDIETIEPDEKAVENHVSKLKEIFGYF